MSIHEARSRGRSTTPSEIPRRRTTIAVAVIAATALCQTGSWGLPAIARKAQNPIAANTAKRTMSSAVCQMARGRRVAAARALPDAYAMSNASGVAWKSPTTNGAAASVIACVPRRGLSIDAMREAAKNAIAYAHQGRLGGENAGRAAAYPIQSGTAMTSRTAPRIHRRPSMCDRRLHPTLTWRRTGAITARKTPPFSPPPGSYDHRRRQSRQLW